MKRSKKFLSAAVAGTLVAAQMAMPVMAADGGTVDVDVDVTTKTAVIRVQVPTTLAVAVNQFEKGDAGSQVFSDPFPITNKSEIPVKVSVTSTVTLDTTDPVDLVSSKAAAESSTGDEAWLAVAAMTSNGAYTEEAGKGIKDLTEANDNVTTFVQGEDAAKDKATAEQTFYLGTAASTTVTYTKVAPTDADELAAAKKISYAQFYELTALSTQPTTDPTLQAEVDKADIYAIDGSDVVTFIEKGTAGATCAAGSTYYTAAPVTVDNLAQSKIYVYGEAAAGGAAGFRYIGKLSDAKEVWTAADIKNITIAYDILGVRQSVYDELKDDCVYGLYVMSEPQMTFSATGLITIKNLTADKNFSSLQITIPDGRILDIDVNPVTWNKDSWTAENGGSMTGQMESAWTTFLKGQGDSTLTLTFTDGTTLTAEGAIQ